MSPPDPIPAALLGGVRELAEEAGRRIMEIYETDFEVEEKADQTPLTAADLAAHHTIVAGLRELTPGWPVLSEEDAGIPFAERAAWGRYWLVDPLDGTREFVRRNGEFCVSIALIEGGEAILGVIHAPALGVDYYARRGGGAFRRRVGGPETPIHTRTPPAPLVVAGSRSRHGVRLEEFLGRLGEYRRVIMGGALKSCLVAEGSADVYARFGPTSEWDTAAAQCILEEAGGALTDTRLRPLRYNTKPSLANPHFLAVGDLGHGWGRFLGSGG